MDSDDFMFPAMIKARTSQLLPVVALPTKESQQEDSVSSDDSTEERKSFHWRHDKSSTSFDVAAKRRTSRITIPQALGSISLSNMYAGGWVMNPDDNAFLQKWDRLIVGALIFVVVVCPLQISMLEPTTDWLFFVTCVVDLAFFIDMLLQFLIMFPKATFYGQVLEHRPREIVRQYLKTFFVLDLISAVPFDVVGLMLGPTSSDQLKAVKIIRALRLIKLTRVARAPRLMHRFEIHMKCTYKELSLIRFMIILAILVHWLANLWAMTLVFVTEEEDIPRWIDVFAPLEEGVTHKTKDTAWKLYAACVYFAAYTVTSVGYGDIGPQNILERIVCIIMLIMSGISWAVVLGQVSNIVANLGPDEQAFRKNMDELQYMMQERNLGPKMQKRLRTFFMSNKRAQVRARHQGVMMNMSEGLRREVAMEMNREWISKVSFLRFPEDQRFRNFVVDVAKEMRSAVFAQSEVFGTRQVLYILNRGLVSRVAKLYQRGSVWGIDFVLADLRLVERVQSFALTYSEATTLRRDVFLGLVEQHKCYCPELKVRVRSFCCWLAFQRAIMKEAARRKKRRRHIVQRKLSASQDEMAPIDVDEHSDESVVSKASPPVAVQELNAKRSVVTWAPEVETLRSS